MSIFQIMFLKIGNTKPGSQAFKVAFLSKWFGDINFNNSSL